MNVKVFAGILKSFDVLQSVVVVEKLKYMSPAAYTPICPAPDTTKCTVSVVAVPP